MKAAIRAKFPKVWNYLRTAAKGVTLAPRLFGYRPRHCNICGFHGRFMAEIHFPDIFNFDAVCPKCSSLPRNRLIAMAQKQQ